jgi:hypothetical protein
MSGATNLVDGLLWKWRLCQHSMNVFAILQLTQAQDEAIHCGDRFDNVQCDHLAFLNRHCRNYAHDDDSKYATQVRRRRLPCAAQSTELHGGYLKIFLECNVKKLSLLRRQQEFFK